MLKITILILVLTYAGIYGYPRSSTNINQSKLYFPKQAEEEYGYKNLNIRNERSVIHITKVVNNCNCVLISGRCSKSKTCKSY